MRQIIGTLLLIAGIYSGYALHEVEEEREGKVLPIFQIVRFPNDVCDGGSKNGTCYTAEECSAKGGTSSGQCASGFGICCTFTLSCGGSASENCTYISQSSVTTLTSPCKYEICKCNTNICRIRFDLNTFVTAGPEVGTTETVVTTIGSGIGDCVTDSFSISNPGGTGSPVICGINTGQHMILDASDECHTVNFLIGGDTGTTRQWDIKVTQYGCDQDDVSGPPGCLQYLTETQNNIASFNFPTGSAVTATATHLSNQYYNICIRRASGYCYICYSPTIIGTSAAITQQSFGVSLSADAVPKAAVDTQCAQDYLAIPGANTQVIAAIVGTVAADVNRICGRFFDIVNTAIAGATVCTNQTPFIVGVNFDGNEIVAIDTDASTAETKLHPGGIVGFKLTYFQRTC